MVSEGIVKEWKRATMLTGFENSCKPGRKTIGPFLRTDMCCQAFRPGPEGPAVPLLGPEVCRVWHTHPDLCQLLRHAARPPASHHRTAPHRPAPRGAGHPCTPASAGPEVSLAAHREPQGHRAASPLRGLKQRPGNDSLYFLVLFFFSFFLFFDFLDCCFCFLLLLFLTFANTMVMRNALPGSPRRIWGPGLWTSHTHWSR